MKTEIVLYQSNELPNKIEIRLDNENETLWLTQEQISQLFERDRTVISKHLRNIFQEGELDKKVVCANFAHTTQHGAIKGKTQITEVKYYNLDAVLSVGYRVNSKRGTQFRIWANRILKDYLLRGYALNNRMNRVEDSVVQLSEKVHEIEFQIQSAQLPVQGVFFDGQIYDAYELFSKLIRSAKKT